MLAWVQDRTWADWWAAIQGLATIAVAIIAGYQIRQLRKDQGGWETLRACEKYDTDPVLDKALMCIREGRNSDCFEKEPKKYSFELMTIANYFEGLATGVRQGFYNEAVVRDHLEAIMREFVEEFFYQPRMVRLGLNRDGFSSFIEMLESWKLDRPYYS